MSNIYTEILKGSEIPFYLNLVAQYKITYFKKFPYLFESTFEDELHFLTQFNLAKSARIILIKDEKNNVEGFMTCIGLSESVELDTTQSCKIIEDAFENAKGIYFIGEAIFKESCKGRGMIGKCINLSEAEAKKMGYTQLSFITVIRDKNHPLKPFDYRDKTSAWQHFGFTKLEKIIKIPWVTTQLDGFSFLEENANHIWVKNIA